MASNQETAAPRLALVGEKDTREEGGEVLTPLEEKQRLLSHHVKLVARGHSHGLFCYGACGGLGKSKVIQETLLAENASVVLLNSHVTALSLYEVMFLNQKAKILWLDDCDGLYADLKILGLLRSALWGQGGERIVTYTSSQLGELPNRFSFESRIIMTANTIPKRGNAFRAVLSRIDVYELSASNEEVIDLMRSVAANGHAELTPQECLEVVAFIEQHAEGRQLSMRLLEPSFRKVLFARSEGLEWQPLVQSQLQTLGKANMPAPIDTKAHERQCLLQAIERHPSSVKEQQAAFCKATGKSRASFFRALARFRAEGGGK
jgi:hypothetical protein